MIMLWAMIRFFGPIMKKALSIFILLLSAAAVSAETISEIKIVNQNGESYNISSVAAFTSFKVGEQVPSRDVILSSIAVDVNRMRESGRYSYVDARMELDGEEVTLIYTVVSKYRLRRLEIVGGKKSGRRIKKKSELEIGQFADDSTFEQAAAKIKEAYRDYWYPDAKVTWEERRNDEMGTVDVVLKIDPGEKLAVRKIRFAGDNKIEEKTWYQRAGSAVVPEFLKKKKDIVQAKDLRKQMQQKQKSWVPLWSRITGSGKYKAEMVDADVFALKSFYMNNGFLDVRISDPVLDDTKPKKAKLIFNIDEGRRYRVGKITLSGMEKFEEKELRRGIRLRRGDIAKYESIEAGSESIRAFYGNRGYIRSSVRPVFDADSDTGIVDIRYEIEEGEIGYIQAVNINGNERTEDRVIRRELVMYPGEKYNRSRVRVSENRLRNLNYFEIVTINHEPAGESNKYDLNVQVKEKPTGQFSAGIGFSSVDNLVGYIELSQGNFNWKTWPPVGAGQKFSIRATLGTERNDLDIKFVEPWFLDRQLSLGVDLFHHEARYFSESYDQKNDGMRLSLGKSLSRFTRGRLSYTMELYDVFDVPYYASPLIKAEEGKRSSSGMDYTWTYDTRDHFFNPSRGNKTTITPYFAGGPLGGETDIYGARIRSAHYWPLIGDMIFNLRGEIEAVEAFGSSKRDAERNPNSYGEGVPLFDRMFLGGPNTLRGYKFREVGPYDAQYGDYVGGNSSAFLTAELTYPIWNKIRGALFYDWGFVNADSWDFNPSYNPETNSGYNDDWGIGLRLDLPGFPLRLDYAWPIKYYDHQGSGGRFNFQIGHQF